MLCISTFKGLCVPTVALTMKGIEPQFSPKDNGSEHLFYQRGIGFLPLICASVLSIKVHQLPQMKARVMFSEIVLSDIWQSGKSEETNGLSCVFMQDSSYRTHSKGSRRSACSSKGPCDLCLLNLNINKAKHRAAAVEQDSLALAQCSVIWVTCCGCTSEIVTGMAYSWDCYLYGLQLRLLLVWFTAETVTCMAYSWDCYWYGLQLRLLLVWLTAEIVTCMAYSETVTCMAYIWVCSWGLVETGLDAIAEAAEGSGEKPNEPESRNT